MFEDEKVIYCIDANILIQAWQKYYSPEICPSYWEVLNDLGKKGIIFIPELVYEEIEKGEDNLFKWLKNSAIPIKKIDGEVTNCLKEIYASNPNHKYLVSSNGIHSKADPWVIAHAIKENAIVVTKETKDFFKKQTKIKIPHVCDNMSINWIDDFEFIKRMNIKFICQSE
jgi:predicted nuclease of predicted toxin-antitoxin system